MVRRHIRPVCLPTTTSPRQAQRSQACRLITEIVRKWFRRVRFDRVCQVNPSPSSIRFWVVPVLMVAGTKRFQASNLFRSYWNCICFPFPLHTRKLHVGRTHRRNETAEISFASVLLRRITFHVPNWFLARHRCLALTVWEFILPEYDYASPTIAESWQRVRIRVTALVSYEFRQTLVWAVRRFRRADSRHGNSGHRKQCDRCSLHVNQPENGIFCAWNFADHTERGAARHW